jgi:hypothetical protein
MANSMGMCLALLKSICLAQSSCQGQTLQLVSSVAGQESLMTLTRDRRIRKSRTEKTLGDPDHLRHVVHVLKALRHGAAKR